MNGENMRKVTAFFVALIACAQLQAAAISMAARPLLIKTQNTINELELVVGDPKLMKAERQLQSAKTALSSRAAEWAKVSETDREKAEQCLDALQKASNVADLANMKANSGLDEAVFTSEKAKLTKLAVQCRRLTQG